MEALLRKWSTIRAIVVSVMKISQVWQTLDFEYDIGIIDLKYKSINNFQKLLFRFTNTTEMRET